MNNVICLLCNGIGNDDKYGKSFCIACDGTGRIDVEQLGDEKGFKWKDHTIQTVEFETDIQLSHDMFIWAKNEYGDQNWYNIHAKIPMLATMEKTLLNAGRILQEDIPGGPNNPLSFEMQEHAKQAQVRQNAIAKATALAEEAAKKTKKYNSYRENLKEAAASAAAIHIPEVIIESTPPEEPVMSIPDRLKSGGRTVAEVMKEGAMIGAVTSANKNAIDIMLYKLGDKCPEMFKTPAGRQALELALPALMLMATEMDDGNRIPGKDYVEKAATLALKGTSAEAAEALTSVVMEHMGILFMSYAAVGKELAEDEAARQVTENPEFQDEAAPATVEEASPESAQPEFE